jgi:muramoyltetrapeptide carboxypeptidase
MSGLPDFGTIAIIAPSSRGQPDLAGVSLLEKRGFKVKVHPQNFLTDNQSAGSAAQRAMAITDVFADPKIDCVMSARGGNRVMHTLPMLDFSVFKTNPKPLIGFSDGTALLNAIYAQTGVITYHGPTLSRLAKAQSGELDQMIAALQGKGSTLNWAEAQTMQGGKASGPLIGGNLSVFCALAGTPYMPKAKGAILFLEDIGDQLSRYDRMLAQLRLSGILNEVSGLIFGRMLSEGDSSVTPFGFSLEDIIAEHTRHLNIPILMDAPFGHSGPLCTLPVGGTATLDADAKTLTF